MDQTDGSSVLACDRRLHRGGLAPGFQLSSVKSLEEEGVKKKRSFNCKEFCEEGFTDIDKINVVIRATLYFILVTLWCEAFIAVVFLYRTEFTWTSNNVARQHFNLLQIKF